MLKQDGRASACMCTNACSGSGDNATCSVDSSCAGQPGIQYGGIYGFRSHFRYCNNERIGFDNVEDTYNNLLQQYQVLKYKANPDLKGQIYLSEQSINEAKDMARAMRAQIGHVTAVPKHIADRVKREYDQWQRLEAAVSNPIVAPVPTIPTIPTVTPIIAPPPPPGGAPLPSPALQMPVAVPNFPATPPAIVPPAPAQLSSSVLTVPSVPRFDVPQSLNIPTFPGQPTVQQAANMGAFRLMSPQPTVQQQQQDFQFAQLQSLLQQEATNFQPPPTWPPPPPPYQPTLFLQQPSYYQPQLQTQLLQQQQQQQQYQQPIYGYGGNMGWSPMYFSNAQPQWYF